MEKQFHWTFCSAPRSLFEEEPMEKQFSFLFSDISGVLWRKKAFDFYLLQALQIYYDDPVEMKYK